MHKKLQSINILKACRPGWALNKASRTNIMQEKARTDTDTDISHKHLGFLSKQLANRWGLNVQVTMPIPCKLKYK